FADHEKIEVKDVVIRKMAVEAEKAKLRGELEMSGIEAKTGKPAAGFGKMIRALQGGKEEGAWEGWREAAAAEEVADALAALKTDVERSALLTAEKELVTEKLVRELIRHGGRLQLQGNYQEALARFYFAQNMAEQIGDRTGIADAVNGIGIVHASQGDYAQALEHFQKNLVRREGLGNKGAIAISLNNIGNVHNSQGNYAQALEYYSKSLALREALGDKAGVGETLNNIGTVYANQGNYTQAMEHFQ